MDAQTVSALVDARKEKELLIKKLRQEVSAIDVLIGGSKRVRGGLEDSIATAVASAAVLLGEGITVEAVLSKMDRRASQTSVSKALIRMCRSGALELVSRGAGKRQSEYRVRKKEEAR